ncbi:MAG: hypothetical protein HY897_18750 [Deltaproteobacteria bacterium]|nr:hypothetical protein [Deltaproteobacteria bacterium]
MSEPTSIWWERLQQYSAFFARAGTRGVPVEAVWGEFIGRLSFKLGESMAEAHVPFAIADDIREPATMAVEELAVLLRRRHEPGFDDHLRDNLAMEPRLRVKLRPRAYAVHRFRDESAEAASFRRALAADPLLDAGLLEAWLTRDGAADRLRSVIEGLYAKLAAAECTAPGEPITALFHMCLVKELLARKAASKDLPAKGLLYERAERAAGVALREIHRAAIAAAETALGPLSADPAARDLLDLFGLSLTPLAYVAIRRAALAFDLNPCGLSADLSRALDGLGTDAAISGRDPLGEARDLAGRLEDDANWRSALLAMHAIQLFREFAVSLLSCRDSRDLADVLPWPDFLQSDRAISDLLARPRDARALTAVVDEILLKVDKGSSATAFAQGLLSSIQAIGAAGAGRTLPDAPLRFLDLAARYVVRLLDTRTTDAMDGLLSRLDNRRDDTSLQQVKAEYEEGRLYRLSSDGLPAIRTRAVATCGQLFMDLKGYTKRTFRAKEIVMAEFLRDEFYGPLLSAARTLSMDRYDRHVPELLDLNNLLGDAIALSGTISSLMAFAREARAVFGEYEAKLAKLLGSSGASERIAQARARWEAEDGALAADIMALVRAQDAAGVQGPAMTRLKEALKVEELRARRAAARDAFDEEVRRIGGFGLEAGLFIAFGAAHESIRLKDGVFGELHVAVGEKINEAARGTARSGLVKARVDARLEEARALAGTARLELPFEVYVDTYTSLSLPPDLGRLFEGAVETKDLRAAAEAAKAFAQHVFLDLERMVAGGRQGAPLMLSPAEDIYNVGQAISAEALDAYIRERRVDTAHALLDLRTVDFDPRITGRFAFFSEMHRFVVSADLKKGGSPAEVFRRAGRVSFRGFEGSRGTVVYEILDPRSPFCELLVRHHAARAAAAAATAPSRALAGLPEE